MTHENFMQEACNEARKGMEKNQGGPFGAVIVMNGKIVGRGNNRVTSTNDPTAHAEVTAIRNACKNLSNFHLKNAVLYTNCEPCPMCLAAIYWANIQTVFFASDRNDAERIGFDDKFIYDEMQLPVEKRSVPMKRISLAQADEIFEEWIKKQDKTPY